MRLAFIIATIAALLIFACERISDLDVLPAQQGSPPAPPILVQKEPASSIVVREDENASSDLFKKIAEAIISPKNNQLPKTIVDGLDTPWGIDFLQDGRMIYTEREGTVSVFDFVNPKSFPKSVGTIDALEIGEGGLLGIAVDPEFSKNRFIYFYYTHSGGNRISRFLFMDDSLINETILIDSIPSASIHNGGRIKFGPDGLLYATTGDSANPSSAQDTDSLAGKILRLNKDGTIPKDNPFGNYVYSFGHRNPQGIAWNQAGDLFASEHGPSSHDEINLVVKGGNYGWPNHCEEQRSGTINPIRCYTEFTLAPGGIVISGNTMLVAALRGTQLRKIEFSDGFTKIIREEEMISGIGRIREVVIRDGYIYIATSNKDGRGIPGMGDDKIIRLKVHNN